MGLRYDIASVEQHEGNPGRITLKTIDGRVIKHLSLYGIRGIFGYMFPWKYGKENGVLVTEAERGVVLDGPLRRFARKQDLYGQGSLEMVNGEYISISRLFEVECPYLPDIHPVRYIRRAIELIGTILK